MVVFEETGGNPYLITVQKVSRDKICSYITEAHPPSVGSWERKEAKVQAKESENLQPDARLKCYDHKVIQSVEFASFGNPQGICGNFTMGTCNAPSAISIVEKVGKKFLN